MSPIYKCFLCGIPKARKTCKSYESLFLTPPPPIHNHSRKLISLVISNGCPIRGIYLQLNSKYYNFLYVKWILYKNISAALSNIALFVIFVRTLHFFSQFFLYFSTLTHFSFVRFLLRLLPTAPAAALAALERPSVSPWTALCVTLNGPLCHLERPSVSPWTALCV
jgi:hypothetical protein